MSGEADITRKAMILFAVTADTPEEEQHLIRIIENNGRAGSHYRLPESSVEGLMERSKRGLRSRHGNVTPVRSLVASNEDGDLDVTDLGDLLVKELLE